jgi:zinc protease
VTDAEVARAKLNMMKQIDLAANDSAMLTISLTESMAAGDWRLFFLQRDRIEKLDAAKVQAVALKYLKPSNRTLGRFVPTDTPDRTDVPVVADVRAMIGDYKGRAAVAQGEMFDSSPANIEARTERFTLANGLKGALLPKKTKGGMVNLTLRLQTGSADALKGKADAGAFAAGLLTHGTERLSRQEIKDAFDKLRTRVSISGGASGVTVAIQTTRDNLPAALDLVAEVFKTPTFPDSEFAEMQREQVNGVEQQMPEPDALANNALSRMLDGTPVGHVNHVLTMPEKLAALKALTVAEVRDFHKQFYGANNATLAAVGDFDAPALKAQADKLFGAWNSQQPYVRIPSVINNVAGRKLAIDTPDKTSSMLFAVHPLIMKDDAAAYPALLMANHMLGGGALRSRLADRIRQKEGLSYGVGSQLSVPSRDPAGVWVAYAMSAPQNTAKVEAALREELALALKNGFSEAELTEAKKGWRQGQEVARTDDAALAEHLSGYLTKDRTMAYDKQLEANVGALSASQVNDALRQFIDPAKLSVVSAGDASKAGK